MEKSNSLQPLDIFCGILRRIEGESFDVERCLRQLLKSNSVGCCVALRVYLDTQFDHLLKTWPATDADAKDDLFQRSYELRRRFEAILEKHLMYQIVADAALASPLAFVDQLLPWFIRVITSLPTWEEIEDHYPSDILFSYEVRSFYSPETYDPEKTSFIEALIGALRHIAQRDIEVFRGYARELSRIETESAQAVLARAYVAFPETYVEDIFDYLMVDKRRLFVGDNKYDSCQLFQIAFNHGDDQKRAKLEQLILDLNPSWELRNRSLGYSQVLFLKSVLPSLLSPKAYSRLQELERKFPEVQPKPYAREMRMGAVVSPISSIEIDKMSDDDLLNAMREYDESTGWDAPRSEKRQRDFLKGGIVEFSRAIGEKTKENPRRFYKLTKKFDETISAEYINEILGGLAISDAPKEWVFEVAEQFAYRFAGHLRVRFCYSLQKRAEENVPDLLLDIMTQWALNDPDPDSSVDPGPVVLNTAQDIYKWRTHGINSVRGVAIETVAFCSLRGTPVRTERAIKLLGQAVLDPSPAVATCVLQGILPLLNDDNEGERALSLSEQLLEKHPQLLEDIFTYRFLSWATFHHFERFGKHIGTMLNSEYENVRQEGARLAVQAALNNSEAKHLETQVLEGDVIMRRGAAQAYAAYLGDPKWQMTCERHLRTLMHDSDKDVQREVALAFTYLKPEHKDVLRGFVLDFLKSPALTKETHYVIDYVKPLSIYEFDLALELTESVLHAIEENCMTDFWGDDDLVSLPLAVYNRSLDETTKNRAIDLFEKALRLGVRGAKKALSDWDESRDWSKVLTAK